MPKYKKNCTFKTKRRILLVLAGCLIAMILFLIVVKSNETIPNIGEEDIKTAPWETGGKAPADYTWEEYLNLDDALKDTFFESFESSQEFDEWMAAVGQTQELEVQALKFPWNAGGKQPSDYTWAEYTSLDESLKDAFFESFDSIEAFDLWLNSVNTEVVTEGTDSSTAELPLAKAPDEYTWEEYDALSAEEKDLFYESFPEADAFERWLSFAKPQDSRNEDLSSDTSDEPSPWNMTGKMPGEFTWEEFEQLTPEQQEAFFLSFDSAEAFEEWMLQAKQ